MSARVAPSFRRRGQEVRGEHRIPVAAAAIEETGRVERLDRAIDARVERHACGARARADAASDAQAASSGPNAGCAESRNPGASSGRPSRRAASLKLAAAK